MNCPSELIQIWPENNWHWHCCHLIDLKCFLSSWISPELASSSAVHFQPRDGWMVISSVVQTWAVAVAQWAHPTVPTNKIYNFYCNEYFLKAEVLSIKKTKRKRDREWPTFKNVRMTHVQVDMLEKFDVVLYYVAFIA